MKKFLPLLWLFILLFSFGCKHGRNTYRGKIIPHNKFIHFLIDLHKYDGVLINMNLNDKNLSEIDSLSYYNYLFKKYDVNYMDFVRTLNYYMQHVDKFQQIYKTVVDCLRIESFRIDSLEKIHLYKKNLWPGKVSYLIPFRDAPQDSIPYQLNNPKPGVYELSADIKVFDDDQTWGLKMTMNVLYQRGDTDTVSTQIFFKDNQFHKYIVKLDIPPQRKPVKLYGCLLHYTRTLYMHVKVQHISLVHYKPSEKQSLVSKNVKVEFVNPQERKE